MVGTPAWIKHYPKDIDWNAKIEPQTLGHMMAKSIARHPNQPCFSNFGSTLTFAEFDLHARQLACALQHQCKVKPGDRIA